LTNTKFKFKTFERVFNFETSVKKLKILITSYSFNTGFAFLGVNEKDDINNVFIRYFSSVLKRLTNDNVKKAWMKLISDYLDRVYKNYVDESEQNIKKLVKTLQKDTWREQIRTLEAFVQKVKMMKEEFDQVVMGYSITEVAKKKKNKRNNK